MQLSSLARRPTHSARPHAEPLEPRRLMSAGDLDATFGTNGFVISDFDPLFVPAATAVLPDGRVLVAGGVGALGGTRDFNLIRLNVDGSFDESFGRRTYDFDSRTDDATDILLLPNGKTLLVGNSSENGLNNRVALLRLNADGSVDNSFSGDGRSLIDPGSASSGEVGTALLLGDGNVLIGSGNAVFRIDGDTGALDASFGGDGRTSLLSDGRSGLVRSMFVDAQDRVWATMYVTGFRTEYGIFRLLNNGNLDSTFSLDGRAFASAGGTSVFIQPTSSNRALLANIGGLGDSVNVRRINSDGGIDSTFGTSGIARVPIPFNNGFLDLNALTTSVDGKLLALGTMNIDDLRDGFVARFDSAGIADASFSTDGVAQIDAFAGDSFNAISPGHDGRIVVAGLSSERVAEDVDQFTYRTIFARLIGTEVVASARITSTGTLLVQGSELPETITIDTTSNGRVRVSLNGIVTTFPSRNVKRQAVFGSGGNDVISLQSTVGASFEANGDDGNDLITGNGRDNVLRGGEGNDTLNGVGGNDALVGNAGRDQLNGGSGDDNIEGGTGNDTLFGASSADTLNGGADTDTAVDPASDILISIES